MYRRHTLSALLALGAAVVSPSLRAQTPAGIRRLGVLHNWRTPTAEELTTAGLRAWFKRQQDKYESLGWVEGKNLAVDRVYSEMLYERVPALIDDLIRRRCEVIQVDSTFTAVTAARATKSIPIVMSGASAYPVECGLIKSFARPGGNVTGVAWFQGIEVHSRLAQFVRQVQPSARRLAWVAFPADLVTVAGGEFNPRPYYTRVAQGLAFELGYFECRTAADLDGVFAAMRGWGAQAVIFEPAALSWDARERIADLAMQDNLPSFYGMTQNINYARGLLGYGPISDDIFGQAVTYIDRILRGARPAELPVEMPTKLELAINLKTAKALGLTIPKSLLLSADHVVE
jgi:putative ABC transport system substrate-binding protein